MEDEIRWMGDYDEAMSSCIKCRLDPSLGLSKTQCAYRRVESKENQKWKTKQD